MSAVAVTLAPIAAATVVVVAHASRRFSVRLLALVPLQPRPSAVALSKATVAADSATPRAAARGLSIVLPMPASGSPRAALSRSRRLAQAAAVVAAPVPRAASKMAAHDRRHR